MRTNCAVVCLGLGVIAIIAACSTPQKRYKVLSFFFDGVPDPDAPKEEAKPETETRAKTGAAEPEKGSKHKPVVERRCQDCHRAKKAGGGEGVMALTFENYAEAWKTCGTCHSDEKEVGQKALVARKDAWLHAPVAQGNCKLCHRAHDSEFRYLLNAERSDGSCLKCHKEVKLGGSMAGIDCSICHDPHLAADASRLFLRGSTGAFCAKCHPLRTKERPWVHGPVTVGGCTLCHDAHGREGSVKHVRRPINPVCLSCHAPDTLSAAVHKEAGAKECDSCHASHTATQAADMFLKERIAKRTKSGVFDKPPADSFRGAGANPAQPEPPVSGPEQAPRE